MWKFFNKIRQVFNTVIALRRNTGNRIGQNALICLLKLLFVISKYI